MTLGALLQVPGVDRLDAQLLAAHHLGRTRAWVIAHDDDPVDEATAARIRQDLAHRARGVPLAYLVGEREFHGLSLRVGPAVLVPRPETELLVDWALELLAGELADRERPSVVDLGTGSGAIALAVKHRCPRARVLATDASAEALAVAMANARQLGLDIEGHRGSWLDDLGSPDGPVPDAATGFDLVLSNPPYVGEHDPHLPALHAEPRQALTAGVDGLDDLRQLARQAPRHLRAGGWVLLEHGCDQGDAVAALLRDAGLAQVQTRPDLAGHDRCTGGKRV